jgi:hypothetical protein
MPLKRLSVLIPLPVRQFSRIIGPKPWSALHPPLIGGTTLCLRPLALINPAGIRRIERLLLSLTLFLVALKPFLQPVINPRIIRWKGVRIFKRPLIGDAVAIRIFRLLLLTAALFLFLTAALFFNLAVLFVYPALAFFLLAATTIILFPLAIFPLAIFPLSLTIKTVVAAIIIEVVAAVIEVVAAIIVVPKVYAAVAISFIVPASIVSSTLISAAPTAVIAPTVAVLEAATIVLLDIIVGKPSRWKPLPKRHDDESSSLELRGSLERFAHPPIIGCASCSGHGRLGLVWRSSNPRRIHPPRAIWLRLVVVLVRISRSTWRMQSHRHWRRLLRSGVRIPLSRLRHWGQSLCRHTWILHRRHHSCCHHGACCLDGRGLGQRSLTNVREAAGSVASTSQSRVHVRLH